MRTLLRNLTAQEKKKQLCYQLLFRSIKVHSFLRRLPNGFGDHFQTFLELSKPRRRSKADKPMSLLHSRASFEEPPSSKRPSSFSFELKAQSLLGQFQSQNQSFRYSMNSLFFTTQIFLMISLTS